MPTIEQIVASLSIAAVAVAVIRFLLALYHRQAAHEELDAIRFNQMESRYQEFRRTADERHQENRDWLKSIDSKTERLVQHLLDN